MNVQLVSFLTACLLGSDYSVGSVEYCYNLPACSPSTWPTSFPDSCNGTRQSPVNIVTANVRADSSLTAFSYTGFNDSANLLNIQNTGDSVKIQLDDFKMSVSGGGLATLYNSIQFHFHWGNGSAVKGSEHNVDGTQYALEMHIVNQASGAVNSSMKLAVLGFLVEATNDIDTPASWKNLTSYLSQIPQKGDSLDIMNQITVESLLQGVDRTKYYRYLGSLTTPFCNESVVWTVFKDPIKVSKNLIDLFSQTVHENKTTDHFITGNHRPTQALNGRVVTSQPTLSTNTTQSTNTTAGTSSASTLHHTLFISTLLLYFSLSHWL